MNAYPSTRLREVIVMSEELAEMMEGPKGLERLTMVLGSLSEYNEGKTVIGQLDRIATALERVADAMEETNTYARR